MKVFRFSKQKYDFPLQMDLGVIEKTPHFFFGREVHCTDFFEIMIFTQGLGSIILDTEEIPIRAGTFLFISPYQKRSWRLDRRNIKGFFLIFEREFLNKFFSDQLFVYRLQFFYNRSVPAFFIPKGRLF